MGYVARCHPTLFQHLYRPTKSCQRFVFAKECADIEHARTLTFAHKSKAEGVHDVAQLITLAFYPGKHLTFLVLDREIVQPFEHRS